jgi:sugar phosphate isomerase/epimerase
MRIGICSYSLHRTFASGAMDFAGFVDLNRRLGCTQLDPWCAHLEGGGPGENQLHAGHHPDQADLGLPPPERVPHLKAASAGIPWGCIAVDGAHVWDADAEKMVRNRARAKAWLALAKEFGATSVRIDAGGSNEHLDAAAWEALIAGYQDLVATARPLGIQLLVENHWGSSVLPANVVRMLESVPGLGLLFDTHNWKGGYQAEGWETCARYAKVVHVKSFAFDADGEETSINLPRVIRRIIEGAGRDVTWCVESVPIRSEDEVVNVAKTIDLIRRHAAA